ncbi:MAG: NADH-quinone oxidoreductase subunit K [Candidatus Edwardsbacteria bacterium]
MSNFIITLMVAHFLASLGAAEIKNLKMATVSLLVQSLFLCTIFYAFKQLTGNESLIWWVLTTFLTKVIFIPWLLFIYIRRLPKIEVKPLLGLLPSLLILFFFLVIFYRFIHTYVEFLAPTPEAAVEPARSNLSLAFTIFALGIYTVIARRDAVKIVIGLILMENGVHLSLVTLTPQLPETTIFGITSNVIIAVFLLLYLTEKIYKALGTTDTLQLSSLKR